MDSLFTVLKKIREDEVKELRQTWFQQQLVIEKRKAFLETLKGEK